jgi:Tfp pilus assembly protein PilP
VAQLHLHSNGAARRAVVLSLLACMAPAAAATQGVAPPKPAAPIQQPSPPAPTRAAPPENYTYEAEGRRDPFTTLLGTGAQSVGIGSQRPNGPPGMTVDELSVRGVMQSRAGLIAMIQGPDNKAYVVHAGDKLLDGVIKAVTTQGLVIVQEVNDPLSLVKQREVIKRLRSQEDGK